MHGSFFNNSVLAIVLYTCTEARVLPKVTRFPSNLLHVDCFVCVLLVTL